MFGLRTKILFGFGGLLAILLMISLLGNWVLKRYSQQNQRVLIEDVSGVGAAENFESAVDEIQYALQSLINIKIQDPQSASRIIHAQAQLFEQNLKIQEVG